MKLSEKFIKANNEVCDFDNPVPAPYIRKSFTMPFEAEYAEITICGLGFYELYINGYNITKGPLAPYISNVDDICYYDNYDVSKYLNKGENVIGILLGNGMRNPFGGFVWDFDKAEFRGCVTVALCFEATKGNQRYEFEADESFKTHSSPVLFDDLRMGYVYDSRLETEGWNISGFDDSAWNNVIMEDTPRGEKKICNCEPIAETIRLKPISVTHYDSLPFAYENTAPGAMPLKAAIRENVYVYDFGVNSAGVTKLNICGNPGQKITIRHGEHNVNGGFSIDSTIFKQPKECESKYLEYSQKDDFICRGGWEEFIPKFKYDGFRYAYVEGLLPEQATNDAVEFIVMNSDLEERAGFECSDEVLNKLQEMTRRSDLANFYYFPTDCPHREKNGWTGDISMSAEHMLLNLRAENSLKQWLECVRKAQNVSGQLPGIIPTGGWGFEWGNGPAWDGAIFNVVYYIYKFTGDKAVIEENVSMLMRYLHYIATRRDEKGLIAFGLGDWLDPFEEENGGITAPISVTDSIITYDNAKKAEFLFKQAGKEAERKYADTLASELRNSIRSELVDFETMTVLGDCQTSQCIAIELGVFELDETEAARKRLVEIVHRDGDINKCGMIGLRYIFHALIAADEAELAYKVLTSKSRTGYGYWVENGETTLCEAFTDKNSHNVGSKNHHFLGDISSLFVQEFAGLKPNPNMDNVYEFEISPSFVDLLSSAKAFYKTKDGVVSCEWKRNCEIIKVRIEIPDGYKAKFVAKQNKYSTTLGDEVELKSGINELCIKSV